ncbi:MAG: hypothetical protein ACK57J_19705 [Rubrivivax sp.]
MSPTGHHPKHVGLQKHSVGDLYPIALVGFNAHWELHNLSTGAKLCYTFEDAPVECKRPSDALYVLKAHQEQGFYRWVPPAVRQPLPAPSRANWYGEEGTDGLQMKVEGPPPLETAEEVPDIFQLEDQRLAAAQAFNKLRRACVAVLQALDGPNHVAEAEALNALEAMIADTVEIDE